MPLILSHAECKITVDEFVIAAAPVGGKMAMSWRFLRCV